MARFASMLLALILVGLGVYLYKVKLAEAPGQAGAEQGNGGGSRAPRSRMRVASVPAIIPTLDPVDALLDSKGLLTKWDKPKLAFLLTGEQHGYIEPCGCSLEQYGGMARRGDLIGKMEDRGWAVAGLDLGGLIKKPRLQSQIKFQKTVEGLTTLRYKALAMGPEDLWMGDFLLSIHDPEKLPFLSANLLMFDDPDVSPWVPFTIFETARVKVGVTSVMSKSMAGKVLPKGEEGDIAHSDRVAGLKVALEKMNKQSPDLRVLLSQCSYDETKKLLEEFTEFDFVVSAGGSEEGKTEPEMVGKTVVLRVGQKGKHAGVLGYYPDAETSERFKFELVKLDRKRFQDDRRMVNLMKEYQTRLLDMARDEGELANKQEGHPHPSGATFVGAAKCGECHSDAFDVWQDSKHSEAFLSLDPQNKHGGYERLKGINRSYDPECISCHVTGWDPQENYRLQSGFINEIFAKTDAHKEAFKQLKGTQCESCHGPGSMHVELIEKEEGAKEGDPIPGRKSVRVTKDQAKDNVCYNCHDLDNSPDFKFETYWPKVEHGHDK